MYITIKIIIVVILCFSNSRADDVRFKNAQTLRNCIVVDSNSNRLRVKTSEGDRLFPIVMIDEVIKSALNPSQVTYVEFADGSIKSLNKFEQPYSLENQTIDNSDLSIRAYAYPNIYFIPISLIAFGFAWNYLSDVSSLNKQIDDSNKMNDYYNQTVNKTIYKNSPIVLSTSELENERTKKIVIGASCIIVGVVNLAFSLKPVEIKATNNSISISYKF